MLQLARGWKVELDRGPDCVFIRLFALEEGSSEEANLADFLWTLVQEQFARRLVVELDELPVLRSCVLGQLVLLHKRIQEHGGLMRLCGVSEHNQQALHTTHLDSCFPAYRNREEALMGPRPGKPR